MIQVPDEIKALLHQDTCKKNIRIHFPNDERADICNGLIVKDSVSFTESLCSQNALKFGLCEASIFECETVGVGSIKGAEIEVSCEIYCESTVTGAEWRSDLEAYVYAIPYGTFTVNSCQRQADIIHRKIVAYGGTANIKQQNEIIERKHTLPWSSSANYAPDVIKTVLMLSGSRQPLYDATMTSLTTESIRVQLAYYSSGFGGADALEVACIAYKYTRSTEDNDLFFCDLPQPYLTKDEIANTICAGAAAGRRNDITEVIRKKKIFGCGVSELFQSGSYVYPYQASDFAYNYIFVPYKALWIHYPQFDPPEVLAECQYRDDNEITISRVDMSNYPQFTITVPRDIEDPTYISPKKYHFDYTTINYFESAQGVLELYGLYGNLNHENVFVLLNIKQQFELLPDTTLYPSGTLYPEGVTGGEILPNDYQSCWYDDEYTKPFGAIHCIYTDSNEVQNDFTYYLTGYSSSTPTDEYLVYELSENAIIQMYMWTQAQIQDICEEIESNIEGVTYMPVDFVGRGLPYVEAGDTFEVLTKLNDSITTIVLNRTLTGDQTLKDEYKSTGTEGGVM